MVADAKAARPRSAANPMVRGATFVLVEVGDGGFMGIRGRVGAEVRIARGDRLLRLTGCGAGEWDGGFFLREAAMVEISVHRPFGGEAKCGG